MDRRLVTTKELARGLAISVASVNYYTNLGLFDVEERQGNVRLYDLTDAKKRFRKIKDLRRSGYSLRIIQKELNQKGS
ncbi:MAG: MerR family transcriptional regulator [Candidatus Omnitrophica bacterium]|nr:MerR family transcriptional regulator [Candidatus Omnitrophota bacterium]